MAKTKVSEWSSTSASNTDINSINIAEGMLPSDVNNAMREMMAQIKNMQSGASGDSFVASAITDSALTSGRVTFASTGGLLADSANLVWDNTNSRLGIGTASPSYKLDVVGGTGITARFIRDSGGQGFSFQSDASSNTLNITSPLSTKPAYINADTNSTLLQLTTLGAYPINFSTNNVIRATIDASGNLGLGVTPSAWASSFGTIQGAGGTWALSSDGTSSNEFDLLSNAYRTGASTYAYYAFQSASRYRQYNGTHAWYYAPAGTAGTAITFTQAMTLDASGNLNLNTAGTKLGWSVTGAFLNWIESAGVAGNNYMRFATGNAEAMRIDSSGNVGIGTTSPTTYGKFVVYSTGTPTTAYASILSGAGTYAGGFESTLYIGTSRTDIINNNQVGGYRLKVATTNQFASSLAFETGSSATGTTSPPTTYTEVMRLDASGNLGLGITPSAWGTGYKALQITGSGNSIWSDGGQRSFYSNNLYFNGTNRIYTSTGFAQEYQQSAAGDHRWYIAPSGTAGNTVTLTQAMTLDANGQLTVGTTTASAMVTASKDLATQNTFGAVNAGTTFGQSSQYVRFMNSALGYAGSISHTASTGIGIYSASDLILGASSAEKARIDTNGNLGLGGTPSAWKSNWKAIEVNTNSNGVFAAAYTQIMSNAYINSASNYIYTNDGVATRFDTRPSGNAGFAWHVAPSGLTGGTITFTQAMTLDASGNLGSIGAFNFTSTSASLYRQTIKNTNVTAQQTDINIGNSAGNLFYGIDASGNAYFDNRGSGISYFQNGGTNAIAIDTTGTYTLRPVTASNTNLGTSLLPWNSTYSGSFIPSSSTVPTNGMYLASTNAVGFATNSTRAVYIDNGQNFGIGPVNPTQRLSVTGTAGSVATYGSIGDNQERFIWGYAHTSGINTTSSSAQSLMDSSGNLLLASRASSASKIIFYTSSATTATQAMQIDSSGNVLVTGAGGLGYGTGSGGAVTQITSRTTGVTLNKTNGAITLFTAAGATTATTFTVTNSTVAATDVIHVCQKSGTNLYNTLVTAVAAGSFNITFYTTGGVASDAPVFNFTVIKAVTA